ncbi:hypothetical protein ACFE04_024769 [Oxalis oulophora]
MALNLVRPKPKPGSISKPVSITRFFSSSNDEFNQKPPPKSPQQQQEEEKKTKISSGLDDIRMSLSQFKSRSPPQQQKQQHVSYQEIYRRNLIAKPIGGGGGGGGGGGLAVTSNTNSKGVGGGGGGDVLSFDSIRNSIRQMQAQGDKRGIGIGGGGRGGGVSSLSSFQKTLREKPDIQRGGIGSNVIGGTKEVPLPISIFQKQNMKNNKKEGGGGGAKDTDETNVDMFRLYSPSELGQKLAQLRNEDSMKKWEIGDGEWSWLEELNERLVKLRKMEDEQVQSQIGGVSLTGALRQMKMVEDEVNVKKATVQRNRIDILTQFGTTPSFMNLPPQEHLVEKYFHPDNMSSAEKMKLELQKVRDGFKMSESDCGSARVQVAQLTTKINHLATALHKKDKHSRKGLQEMVVKRKKLLKYLRRTDWDSYTFLLSKLSLRDNPDYKH